MTLIGSRVDVELGKEYKYTLASGRVKKLIVMGNSEGVENVNNLRIIVDDLEGVYSDIQDAIGEPYVKIEKL